ALGELFVAARGATIDTREIAAVGEGNPHAPRRGTLRCGGCKFSTYAMWWSDDGQRATHALLTSRFRCVEVKHRSAARLTRRNDVDSWKLGRNIAVFDSRVSIPSKNP